jgi:hypothetical protein
LLWLADENFNNDILQALFRRKPEIEIVHRRRFSAVAAWSGGRSQLPSWRRCLPIEVSRLAGFFSTDGEHSREAAIQSNSFSTLGASLRSAPMGQVRGRRVNQDTALYVSAEIG